MSLRLRHPRTVWLSLYVAVNLIAAFIIYGGNELLGETQGLQLARRDSVFLACVMVIGAYIGLLGVVFPAISRLRVKKMQEAVSRPDKAVGVTLFVLQVLFILFFTATGTFVAGATERSDSPLSALWVIISVDSLFFIYYGFYRDSKLFVPNLLISVLSNILRGWTGFLSLIAFMESARLMRSGRLSLKLVGLAMAVTIVAFPILQLVKLQTRFAASGFAQNTSATELVQRALADLTPTDYVDLLGTTGTQILGRLHLVSTTIAVEQNRTHLRQGLEQGQIEPFWKEGIYGIAYDRLSGNTPRANLGVALATAIDPSSEEGSWNSNPGYASWLYLQPLLAPSYLLYTFGLLLFCMYLVKRLNGGTAAQDMLWFACLSYLVPGWIASFVLFANALLLFYLFHRWAGSRHLSERQHVSPMEQKLR